MEIGCIVKKFKLKFSKFSKHLLGKTKNVQWINLAAKDGFMP